MVPGSRCLCGPERRGYPGSYETGKEIRGLEKLKDWPKGFVFHAGTSKQDGALADFRRSCIGSNRAGPRSCGSGTGSLSGRQRDQMGWDALSQGHRATRLVSSVTLPIGAFRPI